MKETHKITTCSSCGREGFCAVDVDDSNILCPDCDDPISAPPPTLEDAPF